MAELNDFPVLPAQTPFVTVSEAKAKLDTLIALATTGGKRFGITTSYVPTLVLSTPDEQGNQEWRIGVSIEVQRYATMLVGQMANWGLPGSCKRIDFVVKAKVNAVTIGNTDGGRQHKAHSYTVLNGSFQSEHQLSTEMRSAKPFRDRTLRRWYGMVFDCTDFNKVLDVVRSEITGETAFLAVG